LYDRDDSAANMLLENSADNMCVGCGPSNPFGMRLAFEKTTDGASASFLAEERWCGFPGRVHSAVLYLGLIEAMNWALYARANRTGIPRQTGALNLRAPAPTGSVLRFDGKVLRLDADARTAEAAAEALDGNGALLATLERTYALVDGPAFRAALRYDEVPAAYVDLVR
jgi:hypothetical protein